MIKLVQIFLLLFVSITLHATDYHVSTNGDDDNDGSIDNPWKTIQYAMEKATAGNTVFIHAGIYNSSLYLEVSGEEGAYITFKNFENDEVIVDGANLDSYAILEIYDKHHVSIEGLIFRNFQKNDAVGILIEGSSDHIRIKDCKIYGINFSPDPNAAISENTNAQPLIVYGTEADHAITDLEILGNEIYDCRTGYSEALAVNGNVDGFLIENNSVHDISNIGIDIIGHEEICSDPALDQARNGLIRGNRTYNCNSPYATSAGIYVDGGKDLVIEANFVYNNQWGIEIGCENIGKSSEKIVVRNNFIFGNNTAGIAVGGYEYPSSSGKVRNVQIVNNTLYNNDIEDDGTGELYLSYNENLRIVNNIISATNKSSVMLSTEDESAASVETEIANNAWFDNNIVGFGFFYFHGVEYNNLSEIENATSEFEDNFSADPIFKEEGSNPDLHLNFDSPMINAGRTGDGLDYNLFDIDGDDRILDGGIDIGADEYQSESSSIKPLNSQKEAILFPNPASSFVNIDLSKVNYKVTKLVIADVLGRKIKEVLCEGSFLVADLKNGVYLVKLFHENEVRNVYRFVKNEEK